MIPKSARVVFMGTPAFAETILKALLDEKYSLVAVYTQPDKPIGREKKITKSAVKILAETKGIPVEQPHRFGADAIETFKQFRADVVIVAAYGKIIPEAMLSLVPLGFVNVHASLLPRLRGASPIHNCLLSGDTETGSTIMLIDKGMDTGPILGYAPLPIDPNDTTETLTPKLAEHGAKLLISILPSWLEGKIHPAPQHHEQATVCQLIDREDGKVFWNNPASVIYNQYRALTPWPGIFSFWKKNDAFLRVKLRKVSLLKKNPTTKHALGEVFEIADTIGIQTADGVIILHEVQLEGKTALPVEEFVRGYTGFIGSILV